MVRRRYYDLFSHFYDWFIKIHSKDKNEEVRKEFIGMLDLSKERYILDVCCGTGSNFPHIRKRCKECLIFGVDFSMGMLKKANLKAPYGFFVNADVVNLPYKSEVFDSALLTYAFYELQGDSGKKALLEIKRVLKPGGRLFIVEHEIPKNRFAKFLYYVRIYSMGFKRAKEILLSEIPTLQKVFPRVEKVLTSSGNTKVFICQKEH